MSPLFPLVQSDLDLNGPVLSFSTQPVGTSCSVASGIATFIGIATAAFPASQTERDTNTGTVTHQWYSGTTALSDGTTSGVTITGSATTTLTLSGLTNPLPISGQVFVQAGYDPNDLSPNAINEPFNSDEATLTVFPTISIDTQPQDTTVVEDIETSFSVVASTSDSSTGLGYQWYLNGNEISGATSSTLSITRPDPGFDKVYCAVSHPTAQPGIVTTTEAKLDVASARTFIQWELVGDGTRQEQGSRDLATAGQFEARARADLNARIIQIFSPERDVDVKITMGGAAGESRSGNRGGEGGISVFKMTLKQNTEYTVKLGIHSNLGGGPRGGLNGGGGLAVLYEKASVIAVCGGGGGAGTGGRGGDGGGCSVEGQNGPGGGANGGAFVAVDTLPKIGVMDTTSSAGGRLSACTVGNYWKDQGKAPCEDVGTGVALLGNIGNVMSDTTHTNMKDKIGPITRGFKSGMAHRNNGGAGSGNGGGGGAGATGGQGTSSNRGGGGASGYIVSAGLGGEVKLLTSNTLPNNGTRQGGNNDVAFICVESYSASDDQEPCIPPNSGQSTDRRTVTWSVSRNAGDSNTVTFSKQSGSGPNEIRFGPNGGNVTTDIYRGAVYTRTGSTASGGRGLSFRLSGRTLELDDNLDRDFNDLQITPSDGRFTSDSRWEANW
jgi:hypothetical protein